MRKVAIVIILAVMLTSCSLGTPSELVSSQNNLTEVGNESLEDSPELSNTSDSFTNEDDTETDLQEKFDLENIDIALLPSELDSNIFEWREHKPGHYGLRLLAQVSNEYGKVALYGPVNDDMACVLLRWNDQFRLVNWPISKYPFDIQLSDYDKDGEGELAVSMATLNRSRLYRQHKKEPPVGKSKDYAERRRASGASPVFNRMRS